jgi:hypothetical protein
LVSKSLSDFKVFVSSRDDLEDLRATAEEAIKEIRLWAEFGDTLHQEPSSQRDQWLEWAKKSDLIVLIVDTKDSRFVRQEIDVCRQNGKKILMLRKAEKKRDRELEDFIEMMEQDVFVSDFRTCVDLKTKIQLGIISELTRKYRETPRLIDGRVESYKYAIDLMARTRRKLFLVTRTLPIITPPLENDHEDTSFCKAILEWINDRIPGKQSPAFYCFYSIDRTKDEILEHHLEPAAIIANLKKYKQIENTTNGRFKISSLKNFNYPLIIGDEEYCVWTFISKENAGMGLSFRCKEMAERVEDYMERNFVHYGKTFDQLIQELAIGGA